MHRKFLLGVVLAMTVGLLALPGTAGADHAGHQGATLSRTLTATLTGDAEVPAVTTDAVGLVRITIDRPKHLLCYELVTTGIDAAAGHIHRAARGSNGPVVVDLGAFGEPFGSSSSGCTTVDNRRLLRNLVKTPGRFYVNLHTSANPGGEIRGQLAER